jgi:pimeloyl-ACP methyl ester carboxylesterase
MPDRPKPKNARPSERAHALPGSDHVWLGDGDRREAVVFLHPGLGTARSWGSFADLMCARLRRPGLLYTREEYDLRDGRFVLPREFVDREAARLQALLRACGITRALVVGSSDGATIALLHAAAFPDKVQAVVSIAAHVFVDALMPVALERIRAETAADPPPKWLFDLHGPRGPQLASAWCGTWRALMQGGWTIEARLPAVRCPVLALQGEGDENGLPVQLDVIERRIPRARAQLLPGLGHFPFKQAPELLVALVARFVTAETGVAAPGGSPAS